MDSIAVVTDSSVQFTVPTFGGRNLVKIIPFNIQYGQTFYEGGRNLKPGELAVTASQRLSPRLLPPPTDQLYTFLSQDEHGQPYDQVLGIFNSSSMSSMVSAAIEASKQLNGRVNIQIINSQTTSVGLGILVQTAAEALSKGESFNDVERLVRSLIPHIYAVICTPSLSYLYFAGFLDRAQAAVGEMLGLFPIFAIEEGHLTPLEKVRNHRQILDFFQEFLEEFENLDHIAFLQAAISSNSQDGRILRDHAQDNFAKTPFSEHGINLPFATLFGPTATGLFVSESQDRRSYPGSTR